MAMFRFLGMFMGVAIRTGSPHSLNLAEPMWKQLAGAVLTPADITEVDRDYVPGLMCIRDMDGDKAFAAMDMAFSTPSAAGHEVHLSNRFRRVTADNRAEYVRLALQYRLHEFDAAVSAVREGLSRVVSVPRFSLFTGFELETMVCGSPDIPVHLLRSVATYKGIESSDPLVTWFWSVPPFLCGARPGCQGPLQTSEAETLSCRSLTSTTLQMTSCQSPTPASSCSRCQDTQARMC